MTTALHRDHVVVDSARLALASLAEHSDSLRYAAVLTDDGFEVASRGAEAVANSDRFASISSSLQALGEAAVRELRIDGNASVLVFSEAGHIVQVRVGHAALVLGALFSSGETIGHALALARRAAAELAERISSAGT